MKHLLSATLFITLLFSVLESKAENNYGKALLLQKDGTIIKAPFHGDFSKNQFYNPRDIYTPKSVVALHESRSMAFQNGSNSYSDWQKVYKPGEKGFPKLVAKPGDYKSINDGRGYMVRNLDGTQSKMGVTYQIIKGQSGVKGAYVVQSPNGAILIKPDTKDSVLNRVKLDPRTRKFSLVKHVKDKFGKIKNLKGSIPYLAIAGAAALFSSGTSADASPLGGEKPILEFPKDKVVDESVDGNETLNTK